MTTDGKKPSKTRRKKAVHELQALGEALVALSDERLAQVEMPDFLRDAVVAARDITAHGARKRQFQYIGKLMRKVDAAPIRRALDAWQRQSRGGNLAHKRVEAWRERLLADDKALDRLQSEHPDADVGPLRELLARAQRERKTSQPPRAYRALYQALRRLIARD